MARPLIFADVKLADMKLADVKRDAEFD